MGLRMSRPSADKPGRNSIKKLGAACSRRARPGREQNHGDLKEDQIQVQPEGRRNLAREWRANESERRSYQMILPFMILLGLLRLEPGEIDRRSGVKRRAPL